MRPQLAPGDLYAFALVASVMAGSAADFENSIWPELRSRDRRVSLVVGGRGSLELRLNCNQWPARIRLSGIEHAGKILGSSCYGSCAGRAVAAHGYYRCGDRFTDWLQRHAGDCAN